MAYTIRDLPPLKTVTTSGGANFTNLIGSLDDASSITIFFTSSFSGTTSNANIHVTQYDPAIPLPVSGVSQSTGLFNLSTALITSSGMALTLTNISFKGLRIDFTATSSASGEIMAYASKQISV
jgi:hypothetical protein